MLCVISRTRWWVALTLVLGSVAWLGVPQAFAAGVVGNGSPGSCTEAKLDKALTGGGSVTFNCGASPKTITLTTTKMISVNTTIDGGGKITLKAQNTNHFQVAVGQTLNLKNISLTGGTASAAGAIENLGTAVLTNVKLQGNVASSPGVGGAIHNFGVLKVKSSTFKSNQADEGGAIYNDGGTVKVVATTFTANQAVAGNEFGGAIQNNTGTLTVKTSTFLENEAGEGGAIYANFGTTNTVKSSKFDHNQSSDSGGAIDNLGNMTISGSTFTINQATNGGGGISHGGSLVLDTSTLSGNRALFGGGLSDFGNSTTITRSTFSGNTATQDGGGIFSFANTVLRNSTLSGNHAGTLNGGGGYYQRTGGGDFQYVTIANNTAGFAGGVYRDGNNVGSLQMEDVLLSGNQNGNCGGADLSSLGGNLSSDTFCSFLTQPSDKQNKNAKLGPLANNGGPTLTHMLLLGSPAINHAVPIPGITTDQRGSVRPKGIKPDIGAVEAQ